MNINSLQAIMLSIAEARSLDPILKQIVEGVSEAFDVGLTRLWLIQPDEECPVCSLHHRHPPKPTALHLRGSAGNSIDRKKIYSNVSGSFHRIPIGERKIGQIAASGKPMLIRTVTGNEPWVADPDWIQREAIKG
ncbi:MAG: hydrogenase, partial [Verrucomicrobiales bacterium]